MSSNPPPSRDNYDDDRYDDDSSPQPQLPPHKIDAICRFLRLECVRNASAQCDASDLHAAFVQWAAIALVDRVAPTTSRDEFDLILGCAFRFTKMGDRFDGVRLKAATAPPAPRQPPQQSKLVTRPARDNPHADPGYIRAVIPWHPDRQVNENLKRYEGGKWQ
jgi:hypothetical protein